jgi:hypothetical protein
MVVEHVAAHFPLPICGPGPPSSAYRLRSCRRLQDMAKMHIIEDQIPILGRVASERCVCERWKNTRSMHSVPFGPNPGDDIGTHTTSHRRLFPFEGKGPASSTSPTTDTMTITHFDFNPHRVFRASTSTSSSFIHERSSRVEVGSGPRCNNWGRRYCDGGGDHDQERDIFMVQPVRELSYRRTRITLPDDIDACFDTDRIVFVRSICCWFRPQNAILMKLFFPLFVFWGFRPRRRLIKGSGIDDEELGASE